ncbi:putative ABC transporter substrate-binding protein [Streptomyces albus]|nr:putative ABC transporter substrate-binding protein [Streptomyces albus]
MYSTSPLSSGRLRRGWWRTGAVVLVALLPVSAALTGCGAKPEGSGVSIGVLQMAPAKVLDETVAQFEATLRKKLAPQKVTFRVKNANGDQGLITSIARDFARSDDTALAAIGTPAVVALKQQVPDKTIIAIAMGDPVGAGVAESLAHPGGNVTGSTDFVDPADLVARIRRASPRPRSLGTIYDPSNQNMSLWIAELRKALRGTRITLVDATVSGPGDVASAARSLVGRADTVLLGPDTTVISTVDSIGSVASKEKMPLYLVGGDIKGGGVLAALGPDYPTVGAQAAETAAKALSGTEPGELPFTRPRNVQMQINGATMRALNITFPRTVLSKSTVT